MKKIIRLTESQLIGVIKKVISEQSEHVKNLYKSWANKKSGNPEEALKLMDDVFKHQKKLSKKDFAQYSSYEELRRDINRIKSEERTTDATKIYEDSDLLVLAANTWEASCKYGAGSKWCTTARDDKSYWNRHNQTGTEFFWIFKNKPQNDPNHKFSYHVKLNGDDPDWCNAINNCMSTTRLPKNSYPKQHPKYNEIIEKLKAFHDSRDMKMTKSPNEERTVYQENQRMLEEMIYENRDEIMDIFLNYGVNRQVQNMFDFDIDSYVEDEAFDNLPTSFKDIDDPDEYDDAVDDYINELDGYLQKNIDSTFDTDMLDELSRDLPYIITRFLIEHYNFNGDDYFDQQMEGQNLTIVNVMENLLSDPNWKVQVDELVFEVVGLIVSDRIYYLAIDFSENYKK